MTLLTLLVVLVVLAVVGYALTRFPLDGTIRMIIQGVLVIVALFLVLQFFGVLDVLRMRAAR
jgi:hypothetical protein